MNQNTCPIALAAQSQCFWFFFLLPLFNYVHFSFWTKSSLCAWQLSCNWEDGMVCKFGLNNAQVIQLCSSFVLVLMCCADKNHFAVRVRLWEIGVRFQFRDSSCCVCMEKCFTVTKTSVEVVLSYQHWVLVSDLTLTIPSSVGPHNNESWKIHFEA